ncbi:hypothetical protein HY772_03445 [Candidatus Woesearchaeota archaeon]|nr:hypothetical protein [Candidatus Woesearchaeota archaeon]
MEDKLEELMSQLDAIIVLCEDKHIEPDIPAPTTWLGHGAGCESPSQLIRLFSRRPPFNPSWIMEFCAISV